MTSSSANPRHTDPHARFTRSSHPASSMLIPPSGATSLKCSRARNVGCASGQSKDCSRRSAPVETGRSRVACDDGTELQWGRSTAMDHEEMRSCALPTHLERIAEVHHACKEPRSPQVVHHVRARVKQPRARAPALFVDGRLQLRLFAAVLVTAASAAIAAPVTAPVFPARRRPTAVARTTSLSIAHLLIRMTIYEA